MAPESKRELGYVVFDRDGDTLVADDLAVDERQQGQGIAKIMYDLDKEYKLRTDSNGFILPESKREPSLV